MVAFLQVTQLTSLTVNKSFTHFGSHADVKISKCVHTFEIYRPSSHMLVIGLSPSTLSFHHEPPRGEMDLSCGEINKYY